MSIQAYTVCVSVPPMVRMELYNLWALSTWKNISEEDATHVEIVVVQNQFRLYESLESLLRRPKYFMGQRSYFPFSAALKLSLIGGYFALDEAVVRELIGKKLIGKTRRDLDDISEHTFVPLASCRRQFDNLCIVLRRIEGSPTDLYRLIQRKFLLPEPLVRSYVGAIFLNHHQIDVNQHESVQEIPFDVILDCAHAFIEHWSVDRVSLAFDSAIAHDVRELKAALGHHQSSWAECLLLGLSDNDLHTKVAMRSVHIQPLVKNILQIGGGLVQSREIRDLLVDVIEMIAVPLLRNFGVDSNEIPHFFKGVSSMIDLVPQLQQTNPRARKSFQTYIEGLQRCACTMVSDINPQ
ncbi:hypothetical protein PSACC_02836 [Paramicrosporidium saccamoebae]|uniref:Uncharacterized protein n=1 Tax=Paramicrosporidium saccamoebae TaxID=1246581 RepID=A0A2H9THS5_9FUNG|nr:hypothetical protein PSACC_02836 [Paramicrosporidium saccamoebae]